MRFGACATRSGHRPGIFPADQARLTRRWHEPCPRPSRRVPSDTGCRLFASVKGGQPDGPLRPAAGVGPTHARPCSPCQNRCAVRRQVRKHWRRRHGLPGAAMDCCTSGGLDRSGLCDQPGIDGASSNDGGDVLACVEPTPAAGRRGLSGWPPSTLALPPHPVSEGTRRDRRGPRSCRGRVSPA